MPFMLFDQTITTIRKVENDGDFFIAGGQTSESL